MRVQAGDVAPQEVVEWHVTHVGGGMDTSQFEAQQLWFEASDGTRVPMFVVRYKGEPPVSAGSQAGSGSGGDSSGMKPRPTILYGYGGFNVSLTPWFSATRLVWMR
jgi:prolyl oligopeptidase